MALTDYVLQFRDLATDGIAPTCDKSRPGWLRRHLARAVGGRGRTATRRPPPPQPCGGASSISYRKRRTRTSPRLTLPLRRGREPLRHSTGSHPGRAWRRRPRSVRAAENLAVTTPQTHWQGLLPRPAFESSIKGASRRACCCAAGRSAVSRIASLNRGDLAGGSCGTDVGLGFHSACTMPRGLKWNPPSSTTGTGVCPGPRTLVGFTCVRPPPGAARGRAATLEQRHR